MNDNTLTHEFEAALQGEPPLGFDPDDVVTMAAQRRRRRRASMLAGVGVAAVAVAAVAVPAALSRAPVAVSSASTSTADWPPAGTSFPKLTHQQLLDQMRGAAAHLSPTAPEVDPNWRLSWTLQTSPPRFSGNFVGLGGAPSAHDQQGWGTFVKVDAGGGTSLDLVVGVKVPLGTSKPAPLAQRCANERRNAHLGPLTCTITNSSDHSVLVMHQTLDFRPGDHHANGRHAELLLVEDFRPDGTEVDASAIVQTGAPASTVLPTVGQLTALVTDPELRITR
jgi:hypothetical protein